MPVEIHKGDIGTVFEITLAGANGQPIDISAATTGSIIFDKPEKNGVVVMTPTFVTDGTDGKIKYSSTASFLDAVGVWAIQAEIVLPTGTWRSCIEKFHVHENIPTT